MSKETMTLRGLLARQQREAEKRLSSKYALKSTQVEKEASSIDPVLCLECGHRADRWLTPHLRTVHGMNQRFYKAKHNISQKTKLYSEEFGDFLRNRDNIKNMIQYQREKKTNLEQRIK